MDTLGGSSDLSSGERQTKQTSSPSLAASSLVKRTKLSQQNVGLPTRHSLERSVPQQDCTFLPGQMLAAPITNQAVCKSAENLYIPTAEISKDGETLTLTSFNYSEDCGGKEDFQKSPSRPLKRLSSSSSATSFPNSANPVAHSHSSLASMASSSSNLPSFDLQSPLPDSYVPYCPSDSKNLSACQDGYYEPTSVLPSVENGDSHISFSSSPRLSPMISMPHISGDSSDEKHERSECDPVNAREDVSFERSISFQERTLEVRSQEKTEFLRASDSSRSLDSSRLQDSSQASQQASGKERDRDRKESRDSKSGEKDKKIRKAWYNVLNPTYKSRSEDLKRLFRDLPSDERLIVDYSCALQKDILVHGRLYVTPNYFCFYSKIFGWETFLSIKCKEIVSMTKEKTALVIPNALQINTESEKHFFTSFAAREKTYLMLFRIWQNALMDQQMIPTELWQWVHSCYGDELGLTSDDDDYVAPSTEDDMKSSSSVPVAMEQPPLEPTPLKMPKVSSDSAEDASQCEAASDVANSNRRPSTQLEVAPSSSTRVTPRRSPTKGVTGAQLGSYTPPVGPTPHATPAVDIPTDFSDTNESDPDREKLVSTETVVCPNISSHHVGREIINAVFALPLDTVFTLLFTNSTFMLDLYAARKTYDVHASPWQSNPETNQKIRQVTYVVTLPTNSFGPKVSHVTETQVIACFSKPGEIYTVDAEACNSGIPYADSFYVSNHWCLTRESANETRISVWSQVKYKKNVWGFMKSVIDKNAFSGMENLMNDIHTALLLEVDKTNQKRTRRRRRRIGSKSCDLSDPLHISLPGEKGKDTHKATQIPQRKMTLPSVALESPTQSSENSTRLSVLILSLLLLLNAFLYHRLWALEEKIGKGMSPLNLFVDPGIFKLTTSGEEPLIEEWVQILHHQEVLHSTEVERWRKAVSEAADYLRKAEEALRNLHASIPHSQASKLQSLLKHLQILQQMQSKDGTEALKKAPFGEKTPDKSTKGETPPKPLAPDDEL